MSKQAETTIKLINAEAFNLGIPAYESYVELSDKLLAQFHQNLDAALEDIDKAAVLFAYTKFCVQLEVEMAKL